MEPLVVKPLQTGKKTYRLDTQNMSSESVELKKVLVTFIRL